MNSFAPRNSFISLIAFCLLMANTHAVAQLEVSWKKIGTVKTLQSKDIKSSRWSIGGETLDRDYANYNNYKKYLGPLGAKRIRLQGGWARCEKVKGQYDFAWLDEIVNDALAQGLMPWLQTSYGNPIYVGGGDAALAGGLPSSAIALEAWDKWVKALVVHFGSRVNEWEIWNEPDLSDKFTAHDYAKFYARTAETIRREQPKARLIGLALCCKAWEQYATTFVDYLDSTRKVNLIDIVSFHGYRYRPEETYAEVALLRKAIEKGNPNAQFWQGENGAPSAKKGEFVGAMKEYDWSELTQAKWNLRRMLGDMGNDVDVTNLFQISDMYYANGDHMSGYNAKGILKTNPDLTIDRPKLAYKAYQNVASIFSDPIKRDKKVVVASENLQAFVYQKNGKKSNILNVWMARIAPTEDNTETKSQSLTVENLDITTPVYVDLITGTIYAIPASHYARQNGAFKLIDIPVPDYPVLITDLSAIPVHN